MVFKQSLLGFFFFFLQFPANRTSAVESSKKKPKTFNWQEQRRLDRERKQFEEDEQTLARIEAPIPQSNIGFKLLKQMGYTPGAALGKGGSGLAEPVGLEIRRSRAGIGREDPIKEKKKQEEFRAQTKRSHQEALMEEFGSRQKLQWRSRRIVVNYKKAKAALDQLENKEIVEPEKKDNEEEEDQEEEEEEIITEEVQFYSANSSILHPPLTLSKISLISMTMLGLKVRKIYHYLT